MIRRNLRVFVLVFGFLFLVGGVIAGLDVVNTDGIVEATSLDDPEPSAVETTPSVSNVASQEDTTSRAKLSASLEKALTHVTPLGTSVVSMSPEKVGELTEEQRQELAQVLSEKEKVKARLKEIRTTEAVKEKTKAALKEASAWANVPSDQYPAFGVFTDAKEWGAVVNTCGMIAEAIAKNVLGLSPQDVLSEIGFNIPSVRSSQVLSHGLYNSLDEEGLNNLAAVTKQLSDLENSLDNVDSETREQSVAFANEAVSLSVSAATFASASVESVLSAATSTEDDDGLVGVTTSNAIDVQGMQTELSRAYASMFGWGDIDENLQGVHAIAIVAIAKIKRSEEISTSCMGIANSIAELNDDYKSFVTETINARYKDELTEYGPDLEVNLADLRDFVDDSITDMNRQKSRLSLQQAGTSTTTDSHSSDQDGRGLSLGSGYASDPTSPNPADRGFMSLGEYSDSLGGNDNNDDGGNDGGDRGGESEGGSRWK